MNRPAHEIPERRINHAMARERQLARERRAHDERFEMDAVRAADLDFRVGETLLDQMLYGRCVHLLRDPGFLGAGGEGEDGGDCDVRAALAVRS